MMTANANAGPLSKKRLATAATARQKAKESVRLVREPVEVTVFGALASAKSLHSQRHATAKTMTATEKSMMTANANAGLPLHRHSAIAAPRQPKGSGVAKEASIRASQMERGVAAKVRSFHKVKSVTVKITIVTEKSTS